MTLGSTQKTRWGALVLVTAVLAGGGGYWLGIDGSNGSGSVQASKDEGEVLYYYDPDVPQSEIRQAGQISLHGYAACSQICRWRR